MFKFLFAAILLLHALIHLMGFAKAFQLAELKEMITPVTKPHGIAWLLVTLLLLLAFILWLLNFRQWTWICLTGIALSQVLVFMYWREAKWGTVANLLLLLMVLPAWASDRFLTRVKQEEKSLISGLSPANSSPVTEAALDSLPPIVAKWMRYSGVVGRPPVRHVYLTQRGTMKLKPGSNWMDFSAKQHFNTINPAFVWSTRVKMMPAVFFDGRDKFVDGKGHMLIRLLGLVNLVDEQDNPRLNSGTALRFLGELCWFPSSALAPYVRWEAVDSLRAKAVFSYQGQQVSGLFSFKPDGELESYEANRYYGSGADAVERQWVVRCTRTKAFNGYRLPVHTTVMWKLPEGDFTWLEMEIDHWEGD